ncbi:MAG: histidinol-phosphate transaminase [Pseudomonadota bacterium]
MASARPAPKPGILDIKPYVPGSSEAPGAETVYKLSSNESALGASEAAQAAYKEASTTLELYPDGACTALRAKIAALHKLDADRIVCGAGSDELLQLLTKAYAGFGDNIVQSDHGFLVYALAAKSCGAEVRFAKEKNLTCDIDAMLEQVDENTRIVFLANPNNPTGTYVPDADIRRLREELRDDVLLVVDAAYAEYMEAPDYEDGVKLVEENENVVMTRTFSKIYGLAALRLGWAYCPPAIADVLNRIRGPFNVTHAAQLAGLAALDDQDFVTRNRDFNRKEREVMAQRLGGLGVECAPAFGNFILFKAPDGDANGLQAYLREHGVIVREVGAYKLPEWLRVSVGPADGNRKFLDLMEQRLGDG